MVFEEGFEEKRELLKIFLDGRTKVGWGIVSINSINEHLFVSFMMAHKTTNVFSLSHFTLLVTSFNQNEGILSADQLTEKLKAPCDTLGPGGPPLPAAPLLTGAGRPPPGG